MTSKRTFFALLLLPLLAALSLYLNTFAFADSSWSPSEPRVNLTHVFEGEINRRGKPTGFHSRHKGQDPTHARIVRIKSKPNRYGVYTADVEIRDGNRWKRKFSSFFPDDMNRRDVLAAILNAYRHSKNKRAQPWRGPSGKGFQIQGYTLSDGSINTAFPVYVRDK